MPPEKISPPIQKAWGELLIGLPILVYLGVVVHTAWMGDDAYITLRTVDNFVHGYGLVWNVGERVQSYTHPLWMLLLAGVYFFTREPYFTTLDVSFLLDLATVWIFSRKVTSSNKVAFLGLVLLVFSKAYVDYSTSGLENPLTFLLFVLFLWIYLRKEDNPHILFWLALLAGLGGLNRLDLLLILLPPLAWSAWQARQPGLRLLSRQALRPLAVIAAGLAPLALWLVFALVYYGFPLPNTAYAKLNVTIPAAALIRQGGLYFLDSLLVDPLTLLVVGASFAAAAASRNKRSIPVIVGMVLYLLYTLRIGGDFMSGRLFTPVFLCAVILLTQYEWRLSHRPVLLFLFLGVLVIQLASPDSNLLSGRNYRINDSFESTINSWGIADERGYYYRYTGLLRASLDSSSQHLNNWIVEAGRRLQAGQVRVAPLTMAGMAGYYAGPRVYLVDQMALGDAFLARLPYTPTGSWRIGHYQRALPCGYLETFDLGKNELEQPTLAAYYDRLALVIRGPLFTSQRWREIWNLNTGKYRDWLKAYNPAVDCLPGKQP